MAFPQSLLRYRDRHLAPHQAQLVEQFFAGETPRLQLLVSPVGTGKGTAAVALIREAAERTEARRVLLLAPGALTPQYADRLRESGVALPILLVRRPEFREMESLATHDRPLWPESIVAVVPIDVAKHKDVRNGLCTVKWDVAIVDEAHQLSGQRAELVQHLIEHEAVKRMLLMTATPPVDRFAGLVPGIKVIEWRSQELVDWNGAPLFQPTHVQALQYGSSPREQELLEGLNGLLSMMSGDPRAGRARSVILRRAQSSLFSLDPILSELHGALIEEDDGDVAARRQDEDEPSDLWGTMRWPDRGAAKRQVVRLIELLGSLDHDSKLEALTLALEERQRNAGGQAFKACIFCSFADVARYVAESLRAHLSLPAFCMTGDIPQDERTYDISTLGTRGGVLVTTDAASEGLSLPSIDYAVNYDLPWNPMVLEQRRGRVDRMGRTTPLAFIILTDRGSVGAEILERMQKTILDLADSEVVVE